MVCCRELKSIVPEEKLRQIDQAMIDVKTNSSTPSLRKQAIQRVIEVAGRDNWERAIAQLKVKVMQQRAAAAAVAGAATGVPTATPVAAAAAAVQSTQARQQEKLFRAMPPELQQVTHFSYYGFTFFTPCL